MELEVEIEKYLKYCEYRKELNFKTLKAYRIDLGQFCKFAYLQNPEKKQIEEYITDLHKNFKQKTVKRKIASLKAFYNYLEEEEIIQTTPFRKIRVKFRENVTLPKIIQRTDIEKLLNYMYLKHQEEEEERATLIRDIAVVETLFATGLRVSELSSILIENTDLKTGSIKIVGKGAKERYVQIANPDVLCVLNTYFKSSMNMIQGGKYLFINKWGKQYSDQSIRKMIHAHCSSAGINIHITPHMFRHSFATYLIEESVDISYVQKMLGHSSIETTQIYLHITSEKQAEVLRAYHPRNSMNVMPMYKNSVF